MWESPIRILQTGIETQIEEDVIKAVMKYGIDIDKDRLLEMLRGDSRSYDMGYATGKREVCERIAEKLSEKISLTKDAFSGQIREVVELHDIVEIVRSEM